MAKEKPQPTTLPSPQNKKRREKRMECGVIRYDTLV